jgi:hypothetical protein
MHLNQVKVFKMLDQNNVTFQGFKFSFNNENAIHRYDQKEYIQYINIDKAKLNPSQL